ncbi:oligosaccharide flippase family protein [Terrabacter terrae]|uniref:oligosaccharide flippase family protein n=1 Tax=Terrabacter terrae TaxID=318434 RepID=UPI0031D55510
MGLGAVRMKLVALSVGPSGVGTVGVALAACSTVATMLGLGLATSGVSAVAALRPEGARFRQLLDALSAAGRTLAVIGGLVACAVWLLAGPRDGGRVAFALSLGLAVASTIGLTGASASLNGQQRFRRIGSAQIASALGATVAVAALAAAAPWATPFAALALPATTLLLALQLASRPKPGPVARQSPRERWNLLRPLVRTGIAASSGVLMMTASQALASIWIYHAFGDRANGYFQACWMLTNLYPTFLLAAMSADFFPRIAALSGDTARMSEAINSQVLTCLRIGMPLAFGLSALAPVALSLVYSSEFSPATDLLRWFLIGEAFKCVAWPLSFVLLARHARHGYMLSELSWSVSFLMLTGLLTQVSLSGVGIAYASANAIFCLQLLVRTGYQMPRPALIALTLGVLVMCAQAVPRVGSADPRSPVNVALAVALLTWSGYTLFKERRASDV